MEILIFSFLVLLAIILGLVITLYGDKIEIEKFFWIILFSFLCVLEGIPYLGKTLEKIPNFFPYVGGWKSLFLPIIAIITGIMLAKIVKKISFN